MQPSVGIAVIETELRSLIRVVAGENGGQKFWQDRLGADAVQKLEERHAEEARRRAPLNVPDDLLAYTHFYELRKIVTGKWEMFALALGAKREFEVWADQIEDFRNAPAHSRELLPYEQALLEGMAGLIRTKVTVFRSQKGPDMNHYPVIESARDSFGHQFGEINADDQFSILPTGLTLRPGQEVTFEARGWDAQGRSLNWVLRTESRQVASATGTDVTLMWVVDEADVGIYRHLHLVLSSSGAYHRHTYHDQDVVFRYRVDPPEG